MVFFCVIIKCVFEKKNKMFESFLISDDFLYTAAIIFTVIGLFAFSWIPYRAYCITAQLIQNKSNIFHFLAFFASLGILYIWSISFYKLIFKCIAGTVQMHCSASRSGELLILIEVALSLVIFELVLFIFNFLKSKLYAA